MLDLLDIFAPVSEAPPIASPWDSSGAGAQAQAAGPLRVDPWDSLGNFVHVLVPLHSLILMQLSKKKTSHLLLGLDGA